MELNTVIKTGTWSDAADQINSNFNKTSIEVEKIKLSSTRNKGLFSTLENLKAAIPSPIVGDWAIVGNTVPGPVYQCKTKGVWSNTGQTGGGVSIDLVDYYTKDEIDPKFSNISFEQIELKNRIGDLSNLETDAKLTIVEAINEIANTEPSVDIEGEYSQNKGLIELGSGNIINVANPSYYVKTYSDIIVGKSYKVSFFSPKGYGALATYGSGIALNIVEGEGVLVTKVLTIPEGCDEVRLSGNSSNECYLTSQELFTEVVDEKISQINKKVENTVDKIEIENLDKSLKEYINKIAVPKYEKKIESNNWVSGIWDYQANPPVIKASNGFISCPTLEKVYTGNKIVIHSNENTYGPLLLVTYDKDKSGGKQIRSDGTYDKEGNWVYIIPEDVGYVGLIIRGSGGYAKIIVSENFNFSDDALRCINNLIKFGSRIGRNTSSYFQKGNSLKKFNDSPPCILVAGQSNADGRVLYSELPSIIQNSMPFNNVNIWQQVYNINNKFFKNYQIGSTQKWGFDVIVGYNANVDIQNLNIIKYAVGGSFISMNLPHDNGYCWNPEYENVINLNKISVLRTLEDFIRNAIELNPNAFNIRALLWHQGESEYNDAYEYYYNVKNVWEYIRGVVGNETLPIIFGTISHKSTQYSDIIENAMYQLEREDGNVHLIDMSGAPLLEDSLHFNNLSQQYLGDMMYDKLIDLKIINGNKKNPIKPW